jgi:hypothetical protein
LRPPPDLHIRLEPDEKIGAAPELGTVWLDSP